MTDLKDKSVLASQNDSRPPKHKGRTGVQAVLGPISLVAQVFRRAFLVFIVLVLMFYVDLLGLRSATDQRLTAQVDMFEEMIRGQQSPDFPVVVLIDTEDIRQNTGSWPFPYRDYVHVIQDAWCANAAAVFFDLSFAQPVATPELLFQLKGLAATTAEAWEGRALSATPQGFGVADNCPNAVQRDTRMPVYFATPTQEDAIRYLGRYALDATVPNQGNRYDLTLSHTDRDPSSAALRILKSACMPTTNDVTDTARPLYCSKFEELNDEWIRSSTIALHGYGALPHFQSIFTDTSKCWQSMSLLGGVQYASTVLFQDWWFMKDRADSNAFCFPITSLSWRQFANLPLIQGDRENSSYRSLMKRNIVIVGADQSVGGDSTSIGVRENVPRVFQHALAIANVGLEGRTVTRPPNGALRLLFNLILLLATAVLGEFIDRNKSKHVKDIRFLGIAANFLLIWFCVIALYRGVYVWPVSDVVSDLLTLTAICLIRYEIGFSFLSSILREHANISVVKKRKP